MPLRRPITGAEEVDYTLRIVDRCNVGHYPFTAGQGAYLSSIGGMEIEVTEAGFLACPEDFARLEEPRRIIEIDPGFTVVLDQECARSGRRVELQQAERALIARLNRSGQYIGGAPGHAGQVDIRVLTEVHPGYVLRNAVNRYHAQAHPG